MSALKVGYLDEDDSDIQRFYDFLKCYEGYEFHDFKPGESKTNIVNEMMEANLDSIVVDYQINEYAPINYNGLEIINLIKARRKNFPCILLTSHTDDAISESFDTHIVYPKSTPFGQDQEAKHTFELSLRKSIEHYKQRMLEYSEELSQLSQLDNLSIAQEKRLIELDDFLEDNLSSEHSLPSHLKANTHVESVKELVDKTEALLRKMDEYDISNKKS